MTLADSERLTMVTAFMFTLATRSVKPEIRVKLREAHQPAVLGREHNATPDAQTDARAQGPALVAREEARLPTQTSAAHGHVAWAYPCLTTRIAICVMSE